MNKKTLMRNHQIRFSETQMCFQPQCVAAIVTRFFLPSGNYHQVSCPKWQLPLSVLYKAATTTKHLLPSGNCHQVYFTKWQLPISVSCFTQHAHHARAKSRLEKLNCYVQLSRSSNFRFSFVKLTNTRKSARTGRPVPALIALRSGFSWTSGQKPAGADAMARSENTAAATVWRCHCKTIGMNLKSVNAFFRQIKAWSNVIPHTFNARICISFWFCNNSNSGNICSTFRWQNYRHICSLKN